MFAIRDDRAYCVHEDFMKAARACCSEEVESKLDWNKRTTIIFLVYYFTL